MKKLKDTRSFKKTKRFLKQVIGKDIWMKPQIKRDYLRFNDWCIDPENITADSVIYSLGVGEDIDFDLGMINKFGVKVYAFDPTPNSIEWVKKKIGSEDFIFHPFGVSNQNAKVNIFPRINRHGRKSKTMFSVIEEGAQSDAIEVQMHTLETIMNMLGHEKIEILKMDIEGAEFDVINEIINSDIEINQILVEFHHRFKTVGKNKALQAVNSLNKAGYKVFFISDKGREYSFLKCTS